MRIGPAHHITGVLDHGNLHTQANTQIRNFVFTGVLYRADLAFHAAVTETARHQNGIHIGQNIGTFTLDVFGVDVTHVHLGAVFDAGVIDGFDQGFVGVQQIHVLTDHRNGDGFFRIQLGIGHRIPLRQIGRATGQIEFLDDQIVQAVVVQHAWNFVDGVGVFQRNNGTLFHVGEQRNFTQ